MDDKPVRTLGAAIIVVGISLIIAGIGLQYHIGSERAWSGIATAAAYSDLAYGQYDYGLALGYGAWSAPLEISSEEHLFIVSDGDGVYSYWNTMSVSLDGGATWPDEVAHSGMIDASEGVLYRVNMSDEEYYTGTVLFSHSEDDGATWSATVEVFPLDSHNDGAFGIFMIQDVLFVYSYDGAGWSDGSIIVSKSSDRGETWSVPETIDAHVHVEDPIPADIVYSGGILYLVYYNYSTFPSVYEVVIVESADMGETWGDRQVISSEGMLPLIKADADTLYVTYWGFEDGAEAPVLKLVKSNDADSWSEPVDVGIVEDYTDSSNLHALAVSSGEVFVAYGDYASSTEEYTVRVNYSADGGDTWADMGDLTGTASNTIAPALSIEGAKLHFTWIDLGTGGWSDEGTTYYRSLSLLEEPIPEFSSIVLPSVVLTTVLVMVVALRKRSPSRDALERALNEREKKV